MDLAGDHYDDFTENLPKPQEPGQDENASDTTTGAKNEDVISENVEQPSSTPVIITSVNAQRVTTPQGVYGKLWYVRTAFSEAAHSSVIPLY